MRTPATQRRLEKCPNRPHHTEGPEGYLAWHEWADKKAETHHQVACADCNLFVIWVPNGGADD